MSTGIAHGRVNLIGEHTDYNGGWVLPTAIPQATMVHLTLRQDSIVCCSSALGLGSYQLGEEKRNGEWFDYIKGATALLLAAGHKLRGFNLEVASSVPISVGLSSSAALEIAFLKAARAEFSLPLSDMQIALLGQKIENEFIGAKIGVMDQVACCFASWGEALLLNTQNLQFDRIKLPLDHFDLAIINSGVSHNLITGGYNDRRTECEQAAAHLGVALICNLSRERMSEINRLTPTLKRRVTHVLTENSRVPAAVEALRRLDFRRLGELFYESQRSMRDDFEVSVPEIDLLIELCRKEANVYGARMTGGGFGGAIVIACKKNASAVVTESVAKAYRAASGRAATIILPMQKEKTREALLPHGF